MTLPNRVCAGQRITTTVVNQIIDALRMFRPIPGRNILCEQTPGGTIVNGTAAARGSSGGSLCPFRVRRHVGENDSVQWEIYLPNGCLTIGSRAEALNLRANADDDHEDDAADWRKIKLDDDETGTFRIIAHGKHSAMKDGVDLLDNHGHPYFYVSAEKVSTGTSGEEERTDQDNSDDNCYACGDDLAVVVATVVAEQTSSSQGSSVSHRITQNVSTPVAVTCDGPGKFDLVWKFSVDEGDGDLALEALYCCRNATYLGGHTVLGDDMQDVKGSLEVWAKFDTQNSAYTCAIVGDPSSATSDDLVTWVQLYALANDVVTEDLRSNLYSLAYWRGSAQ